MYWSKVICVFVKKNTQDYTGEPKFVEFVKFVVCK